NCNYEIQTDPGSYLSQMLPYRGTRTTTNGADTVNWDLGNMEGGVGGSVFSSWGLDVGLTNCDVLWNLVTGDATQFQVTLSDVTVYNNTSTTVWMFIEDFPSVVNLTTISSTPALATYQGVISIGLNATLIGIHIDDDDYLRFGSTSITVAGDDLFNIDVDYGTEAALQALVESLTN
ncbi:MAG: hypothetical protein ABGW83_08630, partial [Flavobacteriaceae bacterium]